MAETKKKTTTKEKEVKLNPKVWELPYNQDLVSQVLFVYFSNERKGTAKAKTRGEVSGGGKKPWRQKGTGRARHGSIRSPLWTKGGVTFVPDHRNWKKEINKKMKNKAVSIMLSERLRNKELVFSDIDSEKKTADIRKSFEKEIEKKTLVITGEDSINKALRNVENVIMVTPEKINAKHIANCKKVVVDNKAVKILEERLTNGK